MTDATFLALKKIFRVSDKISNAGIVFWVFLITVFGVSIHIWQTTGAEWSRYTGLGSFVLAFVSMFMGFSGETAKHVIKHIAKSNGRSWEFLTKAERDSLLRGARNRFNTWKCLTNKSPRTNERAHRSATRSTFNNSNGSKGNSDDGDSDQGDPPGHSQPVTPLSNGSKKPNNFSLTWRVYRPGSWCVSCFKRVARGWAACL